MMDLEQQNNRRSSINVAGITAQDDLFVGEDPELVQLVVEKMKNMDKDGDGRVDSSELAGQMMDAVKSATKMKKKTKNMKYAIAALCGLLCMMAATGLITAYAAAKLAQEVKVSSEGVLVKADGVTPVETTIQSRRLDLTRNGMTSPRVRDLQEGLPSLPSIPTCDALGALLPVSMPNFTLGLCGANLPCLDLDASSTMALCAMVAGCMSKEDKVMLHEMAVTAPVTVVTNTTLGTLETNIQISQWSENGAQANITTNTGVNFVLQIDPACGPGMYSFNQLYSASPV